MELNEYQRRSQLTNQLHQDAFRNIVAAMLGLASESGAILTVYKRFLREKIDLQSNVDYLQEELGDLLWYVATVATAFDLSLDVIARRNLDRAHNFFDKPAFEIASEAGPPLDFDFPSHERFPRLLSVRFDESDRGGTPVALPIIDAASPIDEMWNPDKRIGFTVGDPLGDPLTDNARRSDGYRYHDAIHLGFMAVLGWSPVVRGLLHLKRRSDPIVDETEDGARAIFTEEGLAAVLAQLAARRLGFETETSVDMETIEIIQGVTADLECAEVPPWLWRRAVHQGFRALRQLERGRGGVLTADLDTRTLTYLPLNPPVGAARRSPGEIADAQAELHSAKDAAYGDAWKRRGEQVGVMANIARKIDRVEHLTAGGGVATADESISDTASDLFVYVVKYLTYLADESAIVDQELFPSTLVGRGNRSDGATYVNELIRRYPMTGSVPVVDSDVLARQVVTSFQALEACFAGAQRAPVTERLGCAKTLAQSAWAYLVALDAVLPPESASEDETENDAL